MKNKKFKLTKKIERFFDKLATICGGYANMGVMGVVATMGFMALIFILIDADKILIMTITLLIITFAYLGKILISK
ncbi:hypothetical protein P7V44_21725 [Providencia sp. CRE-3FA-0001]|uniref:Uncharacterized protein n=1 Tax=Providencia huashanensis TaxID=3037798 RepID=A0AA42FLV5_9GAMM|nr:hypothetical protein [Providencia sp. CRE-3FA-0001]MDG4698847.1 hypothetical protein [Providencia sp. CRE-3FA-0001]